MAKDPDVIKLLQARHLILQNLNRMYPTPLQVRSLYRVMCAFDEHYTLDLLRKDVTYLRDKGYIEFIDEEIGGADSFDAKCLRLTAEGKEIADKTQSDPALEI